MYVNIDALELKMKPSASL